MSYDIKHGKVPDLEEEVLPAEERSSGATATLTPVNVFIINVVYQNDVSQAGLVSVQRDYDEYCSVHSGFIEASREVRTDTVRLEELVQQQRL